MSDDFDYAGLLSRASPRPWSKSEFAERGTRGHYSIVGGAAHGTPEAALSGGVLENIASCTHVGGYNRDWGPPPDRNAANAELIERIPDMVDEIVRLRALIWSRS